MNGKVLVTGTSVDAQFLRPLESAGLTVHNPSHLLSENELKEALSDAAAYLLGGDEYASDAAMDSATELKIIAFLGVGYQSFIDSNAARRRGIHVTNTPGTLTNAVAEFTIGQLLNARRRLTQYTNDFMEGRLQTATKQRDLIATRIGIIGLGAIGTRIAEILRLGFGCTVGYFSRTRKPSLEGTLGLRYFSSVDDLMEWAEAYVVMTPGDDSTHGLIGAAQLNRIPDGGQRLLIDTARPSIVDPEALIRAIESDRIAVAVFDSFYDDGTPGREQLLGAGRERLLVTDHIGSLTSDARDGMAMKAVKSILNVLTTGDDEYVVNR